jgi:hypothetical protein
MGFPTLSYHPGTLCCELNQAVGGDAGGRLGSARYLFVVLEFPLSQLNSPVRMCLLTVFLLNPVCWAMA